MCSITTFKLHTITEGDGTIVIRHILPFIKILYIEKNFKGGRPY
jgi:hypothetical protein